jgi:hypothetical protein
MVSAAPGAIIEDTNGVLYERTEDPFTGQAVYTQLIGMHVLRVRTLTANTF